MLDKLKYDFKTIPEYNFSNLAHTEDMLSNDTQSVRSKGSVVNLISFSDVKIGKFKRARSESLLKNYNIRKIESKKKVDMIQLLKGGGEIIKENLIEENDFTIDTKCQQDDVDKNTTDNKAKLRNFVSVNKKIKGDNKLK